MYRAPVKTVKKTNASRAAGLKNFKARMVASRSKARVVNLPASFVPGGSEIKAVDIPRVDITFKQIGGPPTFQLLNGILTGSGFFNRVGARIEMKSIHIRAVITFLATSVQDVNRLIVFYDRQPNGAAPAIADVLQARDNAGAATTAAQSEINLDNRERFVILRDKEWFVPSTTVAAGVLTNGPGYPGDDNLMHINEFIPLKGLGTHYKASTGAIGDIATGSLFAVFISQNQGGVMNCSFNARLRFDDK